MKIAFIGSRGIPARYGGFETFVQEVALGLKKKYGYDILVTSDPEQGAKVDFVKEWEGIEIRYTKDDKGTKPFAFYNQSAKLVKDADIIYSCGVGGVYTILTAGLLNRVFVTNPDGLGYNRAKYNPIKQAALKSLFWFTAVFSKYVCADSFGIGEAMKKSFLRKRNVHVIEYGSYPNPYVGKDTPEIADAMQRYGLTPNGYHLVVARLEPENNVELIIRGYEESQQKYPLVIIGGLKDTPHVKLLQEIAGPNVIFLGGVYNGDDLPMIRSQAIDYLHGHSVGGTNPSLLEAMGSGNLCVCHDNRFNREVVQEQNGYFFGSPEELGQQLNEIEDSIGSDALEAKKKGAYQRVVDYYNWESIVDRYHAYFQDIAQKEKIS